VVSSCQNSFYLKLLKSTARPSTGIGAFVNQLARIGIHTDARAQPVQPARMGMGRVSE